MRRQVAAAVVAIAVDAAPAVAPLPAAPSLPPDLYIGVVMAYAAGDRAAAVARLGTLEEGAIRYGLAALRERPPRLARAAVMLHTDRRLLERLVPEGAEGSPARPECAESAHARHALQATQILLIVPSGEDFARRWFIAMTLHDRWAGCIEDAFHWSDAGARWFPADPEFLLSRGTLYESVATIPSPLPRTFAIGGSRARQDFLAAVASRESRLNEAQRSFERALAADPALDVARLRLGRVLWRLGKGDAARAALEGVIARNRDGALLHLGHLFLARVHQDAGRQDAALREFRAAHTLQPTSQASAMGLSDALQLAGETAAARATVEAALAAAGRRPAPQSFWEYTFGDPRQALDLLDRLREEAGR